MATSADDTDRALEGPAGGAIPGPPGLGYLKPLDGLRGVAVAVVMISHYGESSFHSPSAVGRAWAAACSRGGIGVDLFFVLSGFLITRILLRERGRPKYFRTFYARRTLRIFPLYYGVLIVAFLLSAAHHESLRIWFSKGHWSLWIYLTNVWAALHGGWVTPIGNIRVDHLWSLAIEEQFYLAWPAVVLLLNPRRLLYACGGLVVFACISRVLGGLYMHQVYFPYAFTSCRLDGLAIGSALAVATTVDHWRRASLRLAVPVGLLSATLLLFVYSGVGRSWLTPVAELNIGLTLAPLMFGSIVCLAVFASSGRVAKITSVVPVVWLGRYSYGIYVYHFMLIIPLSTMTLAIVGFRDGYSVPFAVVLGFVVMGCTISIAVAVLSYHVYEMPFLKLKRLFLYDSPAR